MILFKNCFVTTTGETDVVEILHDVRFAIRDASIPHGLVTITLPGSEAGLCLIPQTRLTDLKKTPPPILLPSLSLPFQNKELLLDPKQTIVLIDQSLGGKRREFHIQVMGEAPQPAQSPQAQRRPRR